MAVQASLNINNQSPFLSGSFKSDDGTLAQDAAETIATTRMTVLGKIAVAAGAAAVDSGNTGNGTITLFSLLGGITPKVGTYKFVLTAALVGKIVDPDDNDIVIGIPLTDGGATIIKGAGLLFTITDGATPFIAGDFCTMIVATGSLKYAALVADSADGTQFPAGIYNGDDITAAAVVAGDVDLPVIVIGGDGKINRSSIVFHNGADTLDTIVNGKTLEAHLNDMGLFFKDVVDVAEYENA
ncbi:hypothetical protein KA005_16760 [bacterium]|nr:hypothetical protein [bacterium]